MKRFLKALFKFRTLLHIFCSLGTISLLLCYLNPLIHPDTFGVLSMIGLAYPLVVLFSLITLIVTIFARSRWGFVIGALLILGIRFHLRVYALGSDNEIKTAYSVKIMSYNARLLGLYEPNYNQSILIRDSIFSYLKNEDPDVVCFQEFFHQDAPSDFITRDTIVKILGIVDRHERYRYHLKSRQNFGVCILSRYPFIRKGNIRFDQAELSNNFCIYGDFVVHGDTFRIYNVHLQSIHLQKDDYASFEDSVSSIENQSTGIFRALKKVNQAFPVRARQADQVTKHIRKSPYPVIVCGDFNDTPVSYSYHQFSSLLTDAFRNCSSGLGVTYAGKIPAGRIDYIFHSESLESSKFVIQKEKLSDHYAISCRIFPASEE